MEARTKEINNLMEKEIEMLLLVQRNESLCEMNKKINNEKELFEADWQNDKVKIFDLEKILTENITRISTLERTVEDLKVDKEKDVEKVKQLEINLNDEEKKSKIKQDTL